MTEKPLVSVIIPHFNGREILRNCLEALKKTEYQNKEVIIVNNASTDGSVDDIHHFFPGARVVNNEKNLGYAGGCNSGLANASGKYVLFLNNDTVFGREWLSILVEACEKDEKIAACQPKILSQTDREMFDYAGAAGGLIDVLGYPFARGRLFFTLEKDEKQYDADGNIFWASGTATLIRKSVLDEAGTFDEDFFAHMEEIDLNWRMHLAGYRVVAVPEAIVYHNAGSTLKPDSPEKIYLNHRNSLVMILKNYELKNLLWIIPVRVSLELLTLVYALLKLDFARLKGGLLALIYVLINFFRIIRKRKQVHRLRKVPDSEIFKKMYRGSIAFEYFVRGISKAKDLKLK